MQSHRLPLRLAAAASLLAGAASAQFLSYGTGCPGSAGTPRLFAPSNSRLQSGGEYGLSVAPLHQTSPAFLLVGVAPHPIGIDLTAAGMPGCRLYHTNDLALPMANYSGSAGIRVPIPPLPCLTLYVQAVALEPGANPAGIIATNAAKLVVDPVAETQVHRAASWNTSGNSTFLRHPALDGEPDALVFTTPVWNPPGSSGVANPHYTGVWYDGGRRQWAIFNQDRAAMPRGAGFHVLQPNSSATQFSVTATAANTAGHRLEIDHPELNNNNFAMVFVTPNWNPGGSGGTYNDHPISAYFESATRRWRVSNLDDAPIPIGASFNVLIADEHLASSHAVFVHYSSFGTLNNDATIIDHPALNDAPDATLIVTRSFGRNPHPICVRYFDTLGRWTIANQDGATMPRDLGFYVLVGEPVPRGDNFVHRADASNTSGNVSFVGDPSLDGRPDAIALCTNSWNPGNGSRAYNAHPVGLGYSTTRGEWSLINMDSGALARGAAFNLLVPNSTATQFVHITDSTNRTLHRTVLDHPAINHRRDALVFVCQNFNPPGGSPTLNPSPIGVWYNTTSHHWEIFNQDRSPIVDGLGFNVLIPDEHLATRNPPFLHRVTTANLSVSGNTTYLDHPALDGNPNAEITVTQSWNPPGNSGIYNDHPIGVMYHGPSDRWAIFNEDGAALSLGAAFNVLIAGACR